MSFRCDGCGQTFADELDLKLHEDRCSAEQLVCKKCGERFMERDATSDGWHYRCPNDDCDGHGIDEDLHPLEKELLTTVH